MGEGYSKATVGSEDIGDSEAPNVDELKTLLEELRLAATAAKKGESTEGYDLYSLTEYGAFVEKLNDIPENSEELLHAIGTDKVFVKDILDFMISIPERSGTPEYTWMQNALRKVAASQFRDVDACYVSTLLKGTFEDVIIQLCDTIFSTEDPFELDHFIHAIRHPDILSYWTGFDAKANLTKKDAALLTDFEEAMSAAAADPNNFALRQAADKALDAMTDHKTGSDALETMRSMMSCACSLDLMRNLVAVQSTKPAENGSSVSMLTRLLFETNNWVMTNLAGAYARGEDDLTFLLRDGLLLDFLSLTNLPDALVVEFKDQLRTDGLLNELYFWLAPKAAIASYDLTGTRDFSRLERVFELIGITTSSTECDSTLSYWQEQAIPELCDAFHGSDASATFIEQLREVDGMITSYIVG